MKLNFKRFMEQFGDGNEPYEQIKNSVLDAILPGVKESDALTTPVSELRANKVKSKLSGELKGVWSGLDFATQQDVSNFIDEGRGTVKELVDMIAKPKEERLPIEPGTDMARRPNSFTG